MTTLHFSNIISTSTKLFFFILPFFFADMNILPLLILLLASTQSQGNDATFIRNGYIFSPKGTMFPTSSAFKLVVTINKNILADHLLNTQVVASTLLNYLNDTANTTHSNQNVTSKLERIFYKDTNNSKELHFMLHQELLTVLNHAKLLTQLFTQKDQKTVEKRAIIPWVGKLNSFLFGSATDERVDSLQKRILELENFNSDSIHFLQSNEAALNNTINVVNSLVDNVNKLTKISKLIKSEKILLDRLSNIVLHMSQDGMLLAAVSLLNSVVSEMKTQAYRLTNSINLARQYTLSPSLLPHDQFLHILHNISHSHSLLFEPSPTTLPIFYEIARVELQSSNDMFIFKITLPLRDHFTYPLNLYDVRPYIFPHVTNGTLCREPVFFVLPEPDGLLAVAQSGLNTMVTEDNPNCRSLQDNTLIVCISINIYTRPTSCPASIFLQTTPDFNCIPKIIPQPRTKFYNIGPHSFYVSPNSKKASITCYPAHGPPTSQITQLDTQGFITIPPQCTLAIDSMLIPSPVTIEDHLNINLSMPLTDLAINIPEESSHLILQNKEVINDWLNISQIPLHLDHLTTRINEKIKFHHLPSATTTVTVSTVVAILIGVALTIAIYALMKLVTLQQPVADLTRKLTIFNNHFQRRNNRKTPQERCPKDEDIPLA